jgi:hypothetical protein
LIPFHRGTRLLAALRMGTGPMSGAAKLKLGKARDRSHVAIGTAFDSSISHPSHFTDGLRTSANFRRETRLLGTDPFVSSSRQSGFFLQCGPVLAFVLCAYRTIFDALLRGTRLLAAFKMGTGPMSAAAKLKLGTGPMSRSERRNSLRLTASVIYRSTSHTRWCP